MFVVPRLDQAITGFSGVGFAVTGQRQIRQAGMPTGGVPFGLAVPRKMDDGQRRAQWDVVSIAAVYSPRRTAW